LVFVAFLLFTCGTGSRISKRNRPYEYGWVPRSYNDIKDQFDKYAHFYDCQSGETIASIGAGNGKFEVAVSCFVPGITWYLEEIDTFRLSQFNQVRAYFEKLKGDSVEARFNLVAGTESETLLPKGIFDRVLLINVFHEISERASVMREVHELLKPDGKLVIMERMGDKPGLVHGDCKFPKLYEPDFLKEMEGYGFDLSQNQMGEQVSQLKYYTFSLRLMN
jgi:SAM-dependent methyltransferase